MTPSSAPHPKNPKSNFIFLSLVLIIILISGCGLGKKEELYSKDEAERKFIQICRQEYNWDINTRSIGNTLWIYLPYEHDILNFKANRYAQMSKFTISFLKGDFDEQEFYFEYHIIPLPKSEEDKGYTYGFIEQASEDFRNLLNVIHRVYFNAEQQPEFYVLVMADIANGVEAVYTIYNEDLKKIYNYVIHSEETSKRFLQDIRGNLEIVQDRTGRHLIYEEINLGQFLAKQIVHRIRYRFLTADSGLQRTSKEEISEEILKIISYCLGAYEFKDFEKVILKDLSSGAQTSISRLSLLEEFKQF